MSAKQNQTKLTMNFKVFAVLIAFALAVCVASPIEKPQQAEIGTKLIKKLKIYVLIKHLFGFYSLP